MHWRSWSYEQVDDAEKLAAKLNYLAAVARQPPGPYRGRKTDVFDGGFSVPFLADSDESYDVSDRQPEVMGRLGVLLRLRVEQDALDPRGFGVGSGGSPP